LQIDAFNFYWGISQDPDNTTRRLSTPALFQEAGRRYRAQLEEVAIHFELVTAHVQGGNVSNWLIDAELEALAQHYKNVLSYAMFGPGIERPAEAATRVFSLPPSAAIQERTMRFLQQVYSGIENHTSPAVRKLRPILSNERVRLSAPPAQLNDKRLQYPVP
ncbi:MAG: hypothetical protein ACRD2L_23560, partial [Terriglobia bacterium]